MPGDDWSILAGPRIPGSLDGLALDAGRSTPKQLTRFGEESLYPGTFIEYDCHDNLDAPQGKALAHINKIRHQDETGIRLEANHVASADGYYEHWAKANLGDSSALYHLCATAFTKCEAAWNRGPAKLVVHISC